MSGLTLADWGNIGTVAGAVVALVGLGAVFLELRRSRRDSGLQASLDLYRMWSSREMAQDIVYERRLEWESYDDWLRLDEDPDNNRVFRTIPNFFETVGVACRFAGLDTAMACQLLAGHAVDYWERYEQIIKTRRKKAGRPYLEHFEWFVDQARRTLEHC